jgi:hypothetical protein
MGEETQFSGSDVPVATMGCGAAISSSDLFIGFKNHAGKGKLRYLRVIELGLLNLA